MAKAVASFASRIAKEHGARPFPQAAQSLIRITSEPSFRIEDVVRVIESDPALTSQALSQVNSAVYARRTRCASVHQAATLLGAHALRSIATTAGVFSMFDDLSTAPAAAVVRHGTLVGAIARRLAPFVGLSPDEMYTCGLLHDVGKLMLLNGNDLDYPDLLAEHRGFDALHVREREEYGFDHAVLAGHVLKAWRIPAPVPRVVGWHHQPERAFKAGGSFARRVALLRLADRASYELNSGGAVALAESLADDASLRYLGLSTYALENVRDWLRHEGFDANESAGHSSRPAPARSPSGRASARKLASVPAVKAPARAAESPATPAAPSMSKLMPPPLPPSQIMAAATAFESEAPAAPSEAPAAPSEALAAPSEAPAAPSEAPAAPSEAPAAPSEAPAAPSEAPAAPSEAPAAPSEAPAAPSEAPASTPALADNESDLESWFLSEPTSEDGVDELAAEAPTTGDELDAMVFSPAPALLAPAADAEKEAPAAAPGSCAQCRQKAGGRACPRCKAALCAAHAPKGAKCCGPCEASYAAHRKLYPFEPLAICVSASVFLLLGLGIGLWSRFQHGPRWERVLGLALPVVLAELTLLIALLGARRAQRAQFLSTPAQPPKALRAQRSGTARPPPRLFVGAPRR